MPARIRQIGDRWSPLPRRSERMPVPSRKARRARPAPRVSRAIEAAIRPGHRLARFEPDSEPRTSCGAHDDHRASTDTVSASASFGATSRQPRHTRRPPVDARRTPAPREPPPPLYRPIARCRSAIPAPRKRRPVPVVSAGLTRARDRGSAARAAAAAPTVEPVDARGRWRAPAPIRACDNGAEAVRTSARLMVEPEGGSGAICRAPACWLATRRRQVDTHNTSDPSGAVARATRATRRPARRAVVEGQTGPRERRPSTCHPLGSASHG